MDTWWYLVKARKTIRSNHNLQSRILSHYKSKPKTKTKWWHKMIPEDYRLPQYKLCYNQPFRCSNPSTSYYNQDFSSSSRWCWGRWDPCSPREDPTTVLADTQAVLVISRPASSILSFGAEISLHASVLGCDMNNLLRIIWWYYWGINLHHSIKM